MTSSVSAEHLAAMRHTAAHVLAAASVQLKPDTKLGVGPAIADGFYHDIDVAERYTEKDLPRLQREMEKIKKRNLAIAHREVSKEEARALFAHDPYKLQLIDELPGTTVGISDMGDGFFVTLCKGGHVTSTGEIGHFKLTRIGGVYWKGDATQPQLQRIYGILFPTAAELTEYENNLEEAKKRDHRKIGKELDLFTFSPLVGAGLPLFTPRGTIMRQELERFLQSLQTPAGYQQVHIPHIARGELYKVSGHWEKFKENLFRVTGRSEEALVLKPMNCPHHTQIYASRPRSYRDLPLRLAETTTIYRDEKPGELLGLARVRSITQDDAHVFCTPDQLATEIATVFNLIKAFYAVFGFELELHLSVRDPHTPAHYLGDAAIWEKAEAQLAASLDSSGMAYVRDEGEAAFYGPKIDFVALDSLQRRWQLATIQLDFTMPQRFELTYTAADGSSQTPVMIHRAISGSIERFMAILIEHYAGNFPLWLSPTQALVLPIAEDQNEYARRVLQQLLASGIRAEIDIGAESIGKKIREGQLNRVPYLLIVGKKEVTDTTVAVRSRRGDEGATALADLTARLRKEIAQRR